MNRKLLNIFLMLGGILLLLFIIKEAQQNGDFKIFLEASNLLLSNEVPYQKWLHVNGDNYGQYFYSPLWATILVPFTYVPQFMTNLIWLLINLFFTYRIVILIKYWLNEYQLDRPVLYTLFILTFICCARFLIYNFEMLQMTVYVLWSVLESFKCLNDGKLMKSALLVALAINIKVLAVVFIPYLLFRAHFKVLGYCVLFLMITVVFPALFFGWSFNLELHAAWWDAINPSHDEHLIESTLGIHSLSALIPSLLSYTEGELNVKRNLIYLNYEQTIFILNIIRALLIISCLFILRWTPFKDAESKSQQFKELSYLLLLIPLIFPHQQKYAFFLAMPAQAFLIAQLLKSKATVFNRRDRLILAIVILSFILMTLTTDGLIGRDLNKLSQHFKLITYGTLLLIPAMLLSKESKKASVFEK